MRKILALMVALGCVAGKLPAEINYQAGFQRETISERDARMGWFRDARFGMFVHFGLYSQLGGEWQGQAIPRYSEWIQANVAIDRDTYAELTKTFNPHKFNARAWARTAKEAGMKYLVVTSKHHEGFCLWNSKLTDFDVASTPFKRDLMKELSAACKAEGIKFGIYYSIIDWHHPSQSPQEGKTGFAGWGHTQCHDKAGYIEYMKGQLKELVENYDPAILWFDGDWTGWWTQKDGVDLYNYLRGLDDKLIINNRVCKRRATDPDFGTPENTTPGVILDYDWEACWTINHSWGFKARDTGWKSGKELVRKLLDINAKGGNLLLNVGPDGDGVIPPASVVKLREVGAWIQTYGESLYGSQRSPIGLPGFGRVTQKGDRLYLHLFNWPADGQLAIDHLNLDMVEAFLLKDGKRVQWKQGKDQLLLSLPKTKVNALAEVVVLKYRGSVNYHPPKETIDRREGDLFLDAASATLGGKGPLRLEGTGNLGYWGSLENTAEWACEIVIPGKYEILLTYSAKHSSKFELQINGKSGKEQTLKSTGAWSKYRTVKIGELTTREIRTITLKLNPVEISGDGLMNVRSIILRPALNQ